MKFYVVITVFIAFILIVNIVSSETQPRQQRVIGKVEESIKPFMASIRKADSDCNAEYKWTTDPVSALTYQLGRKVAYHWHTCTGTVVSQLHILTAAHCTYTKNDTVLIQLIPATKFSVAVGSQQWDAGNRQIYCVKRYINHPKFTGPGPYKVVNDISLFLLYRKVDLSYLTKISTIHVNAMPLMMEYIRNETYTVYGWGYYTPELNESSEYLRSAKVTIDSFDEIYDVFEPFQTYKVKNELTGTGDSGGPLVDKDGHQVGVTLYYRTPYSFYACMSFYAGWIEETMRGNLV